MEQIKVSALMTSAFRSVSRQASLREVAESMAQYKISCQLVTDNGRPVGIVTERDMAGLMLEVASDPAALSRPVSTLMSSPVVAVSEDNSIYDAINTCDNHAVRHLAVIDDSGRLTGLVTQSDIAHAHFKIVEQRAELIERIVNEHTSVLREEHDKLRSRSLQDPLMQIGNRAAMQQDLESTHANAMRTGRQYCLALIDVDFFKQYNDHYGHSAGDEVLRKVAELLQEAMRSTDRLYRYGGEEIVIVLADADSRGAYTFMTRAIKSLHEYGIPHCGSPLGVLTGSAGVAAAIDNGVCKKTWQQVLNEADQAMYNAKRSARNSVAIAA